MEALDFNDQEDLRPSETGYYYHTNGKGREEIVYLELSGHSFWVRRFDGSEFPLIEDKGKFGDRIPLPSENR